MSSSMAVTLFVVGLIGAVMLHEWGHFITARRFGMRADRFFFGFGPTLWSTRIGETEYGVKLLPLGGFVRVKGMAASDERLRPVADAVLDPEAVAADRRAEAERTGRDILSVPSLTDGTWRRLDQELARRGTPKDVRRRIVARTRTNAGADATAAEVRGLLTEVLVTEVPDSGHVGDLHHRLLRGDDGRFFPDRPAWQRAIVLVAGSTMHFLIAIVLLLAGFALLPQPVGVAPVVSGVLDGSPADDAGLELGDEIIALDGTPTRDFDALRGLIRERAGEKTVLTVLRDDERIRVTVTPEAVTDEETGEQVGQIGFTPTLIEQRLPFSRALHETFVGPGSVTALTVGSVIALGRVFGPEGIGALFAQVSGQTDRALDGAISVAGAIGVTGQGTAEYGPIFLIGMLASINVFVGVFNLLPLPPLDGGHLAVLSVERAVNAVRRRRGRSTDFRIDERAVAAVAVPVLVIIGTVSMALIWLDITNPIRLP